MRKLWIKIIFDEKIVKSKVFEYEFCIETPNAFYEALVLACHEFDIATPVILSKHYNNFIVFNISEFEKSDFVESFPFDKLVIEAFHS